VSFLSISSRKNKYAQSLNMLTSFSKHVNVLHSHHSIKLVFFIHAAKHVIIRYIFIICIK